MKKIFFFSVLFICCRVSVASNFYWVGGTATVDVGFYSNVGLNNFSHSTFNIYPNPATDEAQIIFFDNGAYEIKLSDITGKEIFTERVSGNSLLLQTQNLSDGVYFLSVKNESGVKQNELKKFYF